MNDLPYTSQDFKPPPVIKAQPFVWRDPKTIPRREFLYSPHYVRRFVTVTVAPGGVGKTSLVLVEVIAMVTGRDLLGTQPRRRLNVWYINLEDPLEEIERRIAAICLHYKIEPDELEGRLFVNSGRDCPVVVAVETKDGAKIVEPVVAALKVEMAACEIDLLAIDPFVSVHAVSENDNPKINFVKDIFAGIADDMNAGVHLVHHVRKGQSGQQEYTIDDGRGAKALLDGSRSGRVLNGMTKDEGEKGDVDNHKTHFRSDVGKFSFGPASDKSEWFKIVSVPLGNGTPNNIFDDGDHVGVITSWEWPDPRDNVSVSDLRRVQAIVAAGRWRENHQAKDWVGKAVAEVLKLDVANKADKRKIIGLLKIWTGNGMFVVVQGEDEKREKRPFVEVGQWATD